MTSNFAIIRQAPWWLALLASCSGAVRAQTAPEIVPPAAASGTDVPYPVGARGDAAVVLELIPTVSPPRRADRGAPRRGPGRGS